MSTAAAKLKLNPPRLAAGSSDSLDAQVEAALKAENRLLQFIVFGSLAAHLFVIVVLPHIVNWRGRTPIVLEDQGVIVADLVHDYEPASAKATALPDANKAPELKVSERMLPQLPKTFKVEQPPSPANEAPPPEEPKPEDKPKAALPPPPDPEKKSPEAPEPKSEEPPPAKPEAAAPKEEPKVAEALPMTTNEDTQNTIRKKEDALRRLALEAARREGKTAKETEAEEKDKLAVAAQALINKGLIGSGGKGGGQNFNRYGQKLKKAVQPNYNIPEVYRARAETFVVSINMAIATTGQIMQLEVAKSSGDQVFDDIVLQAIRNSVPLPSPPPDLAGELITVNFSP